MNQSMVKVEWADATEAFGNQTIATIPSVTIRATVGFVVAETADAVALARDYYANESDVLKRGMTWWDTVSIPRSSIRSYTVLEGVATPSAKPADPE